MTADPPSAKPGEEVRLNVLSFDPEQRSLSYGYAFCDASRSSAALSCLEAVDLSTLEVKRDTPEFSFVMPEPPNEGQRDSAVGIVVVLCPGEIVPGDTDGIPLACAVDGQPLDLNAFEMGVKRVFFTGQDPNHNPTISALRWDGEVWPEDETRQVEACPKDTDDVTDCAPAYRHTLSVQADDAVETFRSAGGARLEEQVVAQFYATGGSFEYDVRTIDSAHTRWVARKADAGKTLRLNVVVRDSRGGVSYESRTLEILPSGAP